MPKVEVFLKQEVIDTINHKAEENEITRGNWIRDAILERLERESVEERNKKVLKGRV